MGKTMKAKADDSSLVISYLTMRRIIGVLGIALPVVVVIGGLAGSVGGINGSISAYYYTNMQDFFVGLMCAVALFLISYKGYETIDNVSGNLCGVFALGVALFPTSIGKVPAVKVGTFMLLDNISGVIHVSFAALFFLTLAFIALFLFTKSGGKMTDRKKERNVVYRICGITIVTAVVCIGLYNAFFQKTVLSDYYPILILETLMLFAFGTSWLVKGETLLKDKS